MAVYVYVKKKIKRKNPVIVFFSYILLIIGSFFLFWSFYPVISFEIYSRFFIENRTFTPIPQKEIASSLAVTQSVLGTYNIFSSNLVDFTRAGFWFPTKPQTSSFDFSIKEYYLSIPKLNIKDALVVIGGEDLSKSLIHYLPKSLPGEYGNVVIFGHSTLPQLYNVKDYKTIFTYLFQLEKGDKIYIRLRENTYEYEVYEMFVVEPTEVSVLESRNDNAYLTLITCVPPGTYSKRLVVRAKLSRW